MSGKRYPDEFKIEGIAEQVAARFNGEFKSRRNRDANDIFIG